MKGTFRYPITDRKIYVSLAARAAGEEAFKRPADINDRQLIITKAVVVKNIVVSK